MFSFEQRPKILYYLEHYSFDVLVIGGGITGAGIALDAASRGLSVALINLLLPLRCILVKKSFTAKGGKLLCYLKNYTQLLMNK